MLLLLWNFVGLFSEVVRITTTHFIKFCWSA